MPSVGSYLYGPADWVCAGVFLFLCVMIIVLVIDAVYAFFNGD